MTEQTAQAIINFYNRLSEINQFFKSPELQQELLPAKIVFIIFTVAMFACVIYLMVNSSYLEYHVFSELKAFFAGTQISKTAKRWKKISARVDAGTEYEYKLALIEADDLLSDILEEKDFEGKTLEEKVGRISEAQLPNAEELLEAHKVRNSVVYDPDYKLDKENVKRFLKIYEASITSIESF